MPCHTKLSSHSVFTAFLNSWNRLSQRSCVLPCHTGAAFSPVTPELRPYGDPAVPLNNVKRQGTRRNAQNAPHGSAF